VHPSVRPWVEGGVQSLLAPCIPMMTKKPLKLLAGALVFSLGLTVILLRSWLGQRGPGHLSSKPGDESSADISVDIEGVNALVVRQDGKKLWEMTADRIIISKDRTVTKIQGLRNGTYFRDDEPLMSFRAKVLRLNSVTKNIEIDGEVQVTAYNGLLFTTDHVSWRAQRRVLICPGEITASLRKMLFRSKRLELYPDENRLICPNAVRVTIGASLLTGTRLVANLDTENVEIVGPITMRARVGEDKLPFEL